MLCTEKKQNILLNEVCVNRFYDLEAACEVLRQKTQNFTYFRSMGIDEEFCKKVNVKI